MTGGSLGEGTGWWNDPYSAAALSNNYTVLAPGYKPQDHFDSTEIDRLKAKYPDMVSLLQTPVNLVTGEKVAHDVDPAMREQAGASQMANREAWDAYLGGATGDAAKTKGQQAWQSILQSNPADRPSMPNNLYVDPATGQVRDLPNADYIRNPVTGDATQLSFQQRHPWFAPTMGVATAASGGLLAPALASATGASLGASQIGVNAALGAAQGYATGGAKGALLGGAGGALPGAVSALGASSPVFNTTLGQLALRTGEGAAQSALHGGNPLMGAAQGAVSGIPGAVNAQGVMNRALVNAGTSATQSALSGGSLSDILKGAAASGGGSVANSVRQPSTTTTSLASLLMPTSNPSTTFSFGDVAYPGGSSTFDEGGDNSFGDYPVLGTPDVGAGQGVIGFDPTDPQQMAILSSGGGGGDGSSPYGEEGTYDPARMPTPNGGGVGGGPPKPKDSSTIGKTFLDKYGNLIGTGISAAAGAYGASKQAAANTQAAQTAADAAKYGASLQFAGNQDLLNYYKQQAAEDQARFDATQQANYNQWAARQRGLSAWGQTVGLPAREIPAYVAVNRSAVPSANPSSYRVDANGNVVLTGIGSSGAGTTGNGTTGRPLLQPTDTTTLGDLVQTPDATLTPALSTSTTQLPRYSLTQLASPRVVYG